MDVSHYLYVLPQPNDARGARSPGAHRGPLDDPCTALCVIARVLTRAPQMESYPKFHNEVGVPIVRIGCREFKCIGGKSPQDHPHVYLNMGDANEIDCPRYSVSIRAWAHMKLIRQIVLTVT